MAEELLLPSLEPICSSLERQYHCARVDSVCERNFDVSKAGLERANSLKPLFSIRKVFI